MKVHASFALVLLTAVAVSLAEDKDAVSVTSQEQHPTYSTCPAKKTTTSHCAAKPNLTWLPLAKTILDTSIPEPTNLKTSTPRSSETEEVASEVEDREILSSETAAFISSDASVPSTDERVTEANTATVAEFPSFENWRRETFDEPEGAEESRPPPQQRKRQTPWSNGFTDEGNLEAFDPGDDARELSTVTTPEKPAEASGHSREKGSTDATGSVPPEKTPAVAPKDSDEILKRNKERFNYASFDCAAIILSTNAEAKGSTAILISNKDQYMLNKCAAKKYIVVELCDEILVDTVAIANYEFFSSMFKEFKISVSNRWPPKTNGWVALGKYRARNSRDIQVFTIEHSKIYARYLRIDFISHYGNEYYCPVSLLRVYGTTMMESYKKEVEDHQPTETHEVPISKGEESTGLRMPSVPILATPVFDTRTPYAVDYVNYDDGSGEEDVDEKSYEKLSEEDRPTPHQTDAKVTATFEPTTTTRSDPVDAQTTSPAQFSSTGSDKEVCKVPSIPTALTQPTESSTQKATAQSRRNSDQSGPTSLSGPLVVPFPSPPPQPAPPGPGTLHPGGSVAQESIFKTIMKRLAAVEHNATMSHRYLEDQSKAYNEVFRKIEMMQRAQLAAVVAQLNDTVVKNAASLNRKLRKFGEESESQLKKWKRDMSAVDAKVERFADEVLFQKKLVMVQFILLLSVFFSVGISRLFKAPERIYVPVQQQQRASRDAQSGAKSPTTKNRRRSVLSNRAPVEGEELAVTSPLQMWRGMNDPDVQDGDENAGNGSPEGPSPSTTVVEAMGTPSTRRKKKRRGTHPGCTKPAFESFRTSSPSAQARSTRSEVIPNIGPSGGKQSSVKSLPSSRAAAVPMTASAFENDHPAASYLVDRLPLARNLANDQAVAPPNQNFDKQSRQQDDDSLPYARHSFESAAATERSTSTPGTRPSRVIGGAIDHSPHHHNHTNSTPPTGRSSSSADPNRPFVDDDATILPPPSRSFPFSFSPTPTNSGIINHPTSTSTSTSTSFARTTDADGFFTPMKSSASRSASRRKSSATDSIVVERNKREDAARTTAPASSSSSSANEQGRQPLMRQQQQQQSRMRQQGPPRHRANGTRHRATRSLASARFADSAPVAAGSRNANFFDLLRGEPT